MSDIGDGSAASLGESTNQIKVKIMRAKSKMDGCMNESVCVCVPHTHIVNSDKTVLVAAR